jgi:serine/threonine protein kinase
MKTRRRQRGGALLGEGGHGITYDLCREDRASFCDELDKLGLTTIILYTISGTVTLSTAEQVGKFVEYLHTKKEYIVKLFKPAGVFVSTTKHEFEKEIKSHRMILRLYGKDAEKYLTITPMKGFKQYGIIGAILKGSRDSFVIFGSACNNKFKIILPNLLIEVLESLRLLQSKDTSHNDIKIGNIVQCSDRYKLIDWGAASKFSRTVKPGSIITASPLHWYCYDWRLTSYMCVQLLPWKANQIETAASKSALFKEVYDKVTSEFYEVIRKGLSRNELFEQYKHSFDLFMLGMTLVYALHNQVKYRKKYKPVIFYLTSILDPPTNATAALQRIQSLLK